jgi:hypothetical protein
MKKLQWWFRIVGIFYVLLTVMNIWFLFSGDNQMFADTLPAPMNTDTLAVRAFMDAWLVFILEFGVLGVMALVASSAPLKHSIMAWVIIGAELFRGIMADGIWIIRGYDASSYIVFIVIHLVIIGTGVWFLQQARAKEMPAQLGMAS